MSEGDRAIEGPAYPVGVKLLASLLVALTLLYAFRTAPVLAGADWTPAGIALLLGALALVMWCLWWIWRSRTAVDAVGVRQSWIWSKQVSWCDVAQARLVGVPGLEWLIAPRLVLRVRGRGLMVFHTADRRVLDVFALFVSTGRVSIFR